MFLVLLRHSQDDLPLRLFESRRSAENWIAKAHWDRPEEEMIALDSDASTPICFSIVEMFCDSKDEHGASYMPRSIHCIRALEDEVKAAV